MDDENEEEVEEGMEDVETEDAPNMFGANAAVAWGQFEALTDHGFTTQQAIYLIASNMGGDLTAPMN